jgi:hypothetical protein
LPANIIVNRCINLMILRPNNKLRSLPSNKSQFTMVINLMGFRPEDLFFLFFSLAACHYEDFLLPRRNEERKKKFERENWLFWLFFLPTHEFCLSWLPRNEERAGAGASQTLCGGSPPSSHDEVENGKYTKFHKHYCKVNRQPSGKVLWPRIHSPSFACSEVC